MFCPNCGKESGGKWCPNCGTQLEIEESFGLNPYEETRRLPRIDHADGGNGEDMKFAPSASSKRAYAPTEENHDLDDFDPYGDYAENDNSKRNKIIAIAASCIAAVIIIAIVIAISFGSSSNGGTPIPSDGNDELTELIALGEKYMTVGNYKEAESVYAELMTISDDDDADTIYKILYNYNLAVKELEDSDFKAAQKYFDRIPDEYPNYSISEDIEALSDDIARYKLVSDIFETVEDLMNDGDYDEADAAIQSMDESLLSEDNQKKLEKFKAAIEESRKKDEEADLSEVDAEILLKEYKAGFMRAVNSGNIDAASYILKGSPLYNSTVELIAECSSSGKKMTDDITDFGYVMRLDSNVWHIKTNETEIYTDADGEEIKENYSRRYVVKYIEGDYYFTEIQ